MRRKLELLLRGVAMSLVGRFGPKIIDQQTGELLGRALFFPWGGRLVVIGVLVEPAKPIFLPQTRLTFWKTELGFAKPPKPDFPSELPRS